MIQDREKIIKRLKRASLNQYKKEQSQFFKGIGILNPFPKQIDYKRFLGVPFKVQKGIFKTRNFYFNPFSLQAYSYGWWPMLKYMNGILVRNVNPYSMQTSQHQWKLEKILKFLRIRPQLTISTMASLNDIAQVIEELKDNWGKAKVNLNHCQKRTKITRMNQVRRARYCLKSLEKLGVLVTKQELIEVELTQESQRKDSLEWKRQRRLKNESTVAI